MLPHLGNLLLTGPPIISHTMVTTERAPWVITQIRDYNHPYATSKAELDSKMAKMAESPYVFYRGTAHIFYQDMKTWPSSQWSTPKTGFTWLNGDAHLGNFDAARNSKGNVVFKIADFDEGHLGQYIWDLRRLAVSMVLIGRDNGLNDADIEKAIEIMVQAYLKKMSKFSKSNAEKHFILDADNTSGVVAKTIKAADAKSRLQLLAKYTTLNGNKRILLDLPNLVSVDANTHSGVAAAMDSYRASIHPSKRYAADYYTIKDVRQKLGSGTSSLGKRRLYVLIEGPSTATDDDVILEWKQESRSVVAIAAPTQMPASIYHNHEGARVARTAQAQLLHADVLIGYTSIGDTQYYVHEKSPYQEDLAPETLNTAGKMTTAALYLGQALASAHTLANQDNDLSVVGYNIDKQIHNTVSHKKQLEKELRRFAFNYATQVMLDWRGFVTAYHTGTPLY
ncbi:DUF2252 domain-containing protein [Xylella fastidiosa]|uniref:DUF2252 domain-containing protein n=2 Tax=Xylella fastidiosa TaxID=2371 RepID=A0A9Q4QT00_XYLFS|nr:DUF2252 domain-containing protein [Xylella fastidiosa]ACA11816.1 conserved hypothetical protein [Xylella fastidiosa M12]MBE0268446.1 DUF2252 domain-containing protein [Xylella fastidiosa subsp. multiplex]MBE0275327.1 DUF2252 domain-containing protein [Xylella fastidiosa subsp. multiplex]MBE0277500.1 DUF2252 domain-containing protein [Xylella fastidiosa subsp. multiplex]MBE0281658.1 DUF2252 domain-containing protein [Xylella fastidiosa subsp. multiplex]